MLKLTKGTSNTIRVSLGEIQEIALPTFLIAFEHDASEAVVTCISADLSLYPERYNEFVIVEKSSPVALNGEVELEPVGFFTYRIYEQTSTTNLDESLADKLLDTGKARVVFDGDRKATAFVTYSPMMGQDAFWDVFASEGIVVTPPTTDATYENSDTSFTQVIAGGATFVAPDITWIDSDLTVNTAPANTDITCTPDTVVLKGFFLISEANCVQFTIDSDSAGTYTSITDDGASGSITISVNGGAFSGFSNPLILAVSDTLDVARTTTTAAGFYKITGA